MFVMGSIALDSGVDASVVAGWEAQADRLIADQSLASVRRHQLDRDDIRAGIEALGPVIAVLETAEPALKAELYSSLNLRLTYQPERNSVAVEAAPAPCAKVRVGGGTRTVTPRASADGEFAIAA